jgi:putative Holliday junction resolvase
LIPATGRVLGVDLGSARIGVALSDSGQRVASALTTMRRSGDPEADRRALAGLVAEEEAVGVVVGLPRSLDGSLGPAAQAALDEVSRLGQVLCGVGVETVDERFTTVAAHQALRVSVRATAAGRAARGARRGREARGRVDSVAATILLQSWLDRRLSLRGVAR